MPEFSDLEDEIPYPLPPTTVAPMTTKMADGPNALKVPTSLSGTFEVPKKTSSYNRKGEEAFGKEKKNQPTLSAAVQVIFQLKRLLLF
jgi:hypothetical protein